MPAKFTYIITVIFLLIFPIISITCEDDGTNYTNLSPNQPSNPAPADGALNQPVDVQLIWRCSDPDGDPLVYDIFFGTAMFPPGVASNQSDTTYQPDQLQHNTTYYWKIVAKDPRTYRTGPIWSFSTEEE